MRKFNTITSFAKAHNAMYRYLKDNNLLEQAKNTVFNKEKFLTQWTDDELLVEANKYDTYSDLKEKNPRLYLLMLPKNRNLLGKSGLTKDIKRRWVTKEECINAANKCTTRYEMSKRFNVEYQCSLRNDWIDDITKHFLPVGNLYKRMVYCYLFNDNSVYIGLTCNKQRRQWEHNTHKKTSVNKHLQEGKIINNFIDLSNGYIDAEDAISLEKYYVEEYKSKGVNVLNKMKAGGLGSFQLPKNNIQ